MVGLAAAAAAILGIASAGYQAAGEARDRRRHPPPGRLVDVGGYRLHIVCAGRGSPAVVIVPALGATAAEWQKVQRRLTQQTAVCVYDRAGLGYSDSPKKHRTAQRMAEELHALLHAAGIAPPYVLCGHSLGGLIARVFIQMYQDEVAGLALIDASHPEMPKRLPRTALWHYPGGHLLAAAREWGRPLGPRRLARDIGLRAADTVPWACQRRADAGEIAGIKAICRDTDMIVGNLGDLPLAVLTSAETDPSHAPGSRRAHARSRFYVTWVVLQNELTALSTASTHVTAEHGGHHLNRDNPELVCEIIAGLVRQARS